MLPAGNMPLLVVEAVMKPPEIDPPLEEAVIMLPAGILPQSMVDITMSLEGISRRLAGDLFEREP